MWYLICLAVWKSQLLSVQCRFLSFCFIFGFLSHSNIQLAFIRFGRDVRRKLGTKRKSNSRLYTFYELLLPLLLLRNWTFRDMVAHLFKNNRGSCISPETSSCFQVPGPCRFYGCFVASILSNDVDNKVKHKSVSMNYCSKCSIWRVSKNLVGVKLRI